MSYSDTLPTGSLINNEYQIQRLLGTGGFANTYLAQDLPLQRSVAIKEYYPRRCAVRSNGVTVGAKSNQLRKDYLWGLKRFTREAKIIARFKHPSIVRIFRVLDAHNTAYIILEYVEGADLEALLKQRNARLSQQEVDTLLPSLLNALALVHREGVLHRDIKPANIYIRAVDGNPVLLDFGASKFEMGEMSGTTLAVVSCGYSPQEAYATDPHLQGPWTDIYGLAATLYFMLTQMAPPEATERVLEDRIVPARQLPLKGYRESFLAAIDWGLRVQPTHRPQNVMDWVPALLHGAAPRAAASAAGPTRMRAPASAVLPKGLSAPETRQAERPRSAHVPVLSSPEPRLPVVPSQARTASQPAAPPRSAVEALAEPPRKRRTAIQSSVQILATLSRRRWSARQLEHVPVLLAKIVFGAVLVLLIGITAWWWEPYLSSASTAFSSFWYPTPNLERSYTRGSYGSYEPPSSDTGRRPASESVSSPRSRSMSGSENRETGSSGHSRPAYRAPASSDRGTSASGAIAVPQ